MKRILTAEQMKRCDSYTIDTVGVPSRELMQRAAESAFREIMSGGFDLTKVLCICGTGNNGGDGLAVAMLLQSAGVNVEFFICGNEERMTEECRYRYNEMFRKGITEQTDLDLDGVTLIVDAVLGIGLSGDVRGVAADVITAVSESGIPVASLDIPSGINSDTGAVMGCAVKAELTVAFARLKPGHVLYPGRSYSGKTVTADIGIGEEGIEKDDLRIYSPDDGDVIRMLPERYPDGHKGTFGRVLVVAGSEGMCGAAYFSAFGAYRSGAGLVEVLTPRMNMPIIQTKIPEAIVTPWDRDPERLLRERLRCADACVIGPGLGRSSDAVRLVEEVLGCRVPLLIDADGLNIIAESDDLRKSLAARAYPTVITPHMGEMSRLCGCSVGDVCRDPIKIALDFADRYGVVCVQKSAVTVVAHEGTVYLNPTGCSGLAKGGSGDVLSGVIGAFMASGKDAFSSAVCGVYLHGRAGETASEKLSEYSLLASDIADNIGHAILSLKK